MMIDKLKAFITDWEAHGGQEIDHQTRHILHAFAMWVDIQSPRPPDLGVSVEETIRASDNMSDG